MNFYPRSPLRRATCLVLIPGTQIQISIHALLAESDDPTGQRSGQQLLFLSTLSLRRATCFYCEICSRCYFYPRSPCGERHTFPHNGVEAGAISIHALLAESDLEWNGQRKSVHISIHALLAESDALPHTSGVVPPGFLSTLSLRRATMDVREKLIDILNFYPRSPCGERHHRLQRKHQG